MKSTGSLPNGRLVIKIENAATRKDLTYTVNLPVHLQGKTLHAWIAFKNQDETNASNSLYLGSIS